MDDVDNPWISSISTRIYPPSMDIYPDASLVVPRFVISVPQFRNFHLIRTCVSDSGCATSGHSQTSFASRTFNTEYYSTIICTHIIVYVYQDFASLEKFKMCCRLNKMQNGHLSCLMADISGCEKNGSSSTSFAHHTFNTKYYSIIIFMHILVYVY